MAVILENKSGRRMVRLNSNDIVEIVREYQKITVGSYTSNEIREKLQNIELYLPEEVLYY